jgi:two-component system sensor histidine kinase HydH
MARATKSWLRWVSRGVFIVSALAALGLAATVTVARAGLRDAALVLVRGEGETLLSRGRKVLRQPPTQAVLERLLEEGRSSGLRYVALVDPRSEAWLEAGTETLRDRSMRPGDIRTRGPLARLVQVLPARLNGRGGLPGEPPWGPPPDGAQRDRPPREGPPEGPRDGPPDRPAEGPRGEPRRDGPPEGPDQPPPPPEARQEQPPDAPPDARPDGPPRQGRGSPPLVVIEFETPVLAHLSDALDRAALIAGLVSVLLLSAAGLFARTAANQAAVEQAAERDRRLVLLGQMSSVMAHELRNPLASLKGQAQLLAEALAGNGNTQTPGGTAGLAKAAERAGRVVLEAERLEKLTSDLLAFVGDAPLSKSLVTPQALLAHATAGLPAARLELDTAAAPGALLVDEVRITAALSNLLRNGLQADEAGGKVSVSIAAAGPDVTLMVRDRGPGLPKGGEEKVFEPFFTTRVRGTGLGLPMARRVAEQHGGTLRGTTHPEGGAVFTLVLPAAARPAASGHTEG